MLSRLGLSPDMFSRGGQETLAHIAATARSLHLQGCEQYMFLVALLQLREQQHSLYCAQVMLSAQTTHSSVSRSYIGTERRNKRTCCNSGWLSTNRRLCSKCKGYRACLQTHNCIHRVQQQTLTCTIKTSCYLLRRRSSTISRYQGLTVI